MFITLEGKKSQLAGGMLPFYEGQVSGSASKYRPCQSVNFNEHPDLREWKLISPFAHNFEGVFKSMWLSGSKRSQAIQG